MEKEYYYAETKCKNCKKVNYFNKIPNGKTINEYLDEEGTKCRVCGCLLFYEKESKPKAKGRKKKGEAESEE